jgi:hypothetical protein
MLGKYQYQIISKVEAADRQLRVAIRLFFERKDLLAVHTLAAAAQGILTDLARPKDIKIIFDRLDPDLRRAYRLAQNFLKHADKDPEQQFAFFPEATKFHLFEAAVVHSILTQTMSPEVTGFLGWFLKTFPHWFDTRDWPEFGRIIDLAKGENFDDFDLVLAAIDKEYHQAQPESGGS